MVSPEPFGARLRRLRESLDMSRSQLSRATVGVDPAGKGLPEITIKQLERGARLQPRVHTIELLAAALDVPPAEFLEYRLAKAREALDEQQVGLAAALRTLAEIEDRLG
jgi:transcriptional regulator with XRE-family HTH domain